jgi:hypothetical protein
MLGGPVNALRRRFLAPIGGLIGVTRLELGEAAAGAGTEVAERLTWHRAALAVAALRSRCLVTRHGLCHGSENRTGYTCHTRSTPPMRPVQRARSWAQGALRKVRKRLLSLARRTHIGSGAGPAARTAVALVQALQRWPTSGALGVESNVRRQRCSMGKMLSIQFKGERTRLGRQRRGSCVLQARVRKFGGSSTSLGRRRRRGCKLPRLKYRSKGVTQGEGAAWTRRGARWRSA